jgi:hypothetical protein
MPAQLMKVWWLIGPLTILVLLGRLVLAGQASVRVGAARADRDDYADWPMARLTSGEEMDDPRHVQRRLSIALMIWLGLLWVASPALACARMADRDCCPSGTTSPCEGTRVDLSPVNALCCVTAPATSASAAIDASRTAHVQPHTPAGPDPIAALAWLATLTPSGEPSLLAPPDLVITRTDAARTYLHTRRLRL